MERLNQDSQDSRIYRNKFGISLIAVLMFMLAATTASVVVFRMIGSENFSSGARLKATEAYQASESGVDAVRAWLSNRAFDASGLVTQYETQKSPVELKNIGGIGVDENKQKFKAFLVGVDFKPNSVMKLKFIVEGFGRDDSKVSQAVIFSTDGLYKVNVTVPPTVNPTEIDERALWATGNVYMDGDATNLPITSAVINGNWSGNPSRVEKDFIVTGDAVLSGNDVQIGRYICIGGNAAFQNNNLQSGSIYVGKDFGFFTVMGGRNELAGAGGNFSNIYVEGNLRQASSKGDFTARENLEVNGKIEPTEAQTFIVNGNLVLGSAGQIQFKLSQTALFDVKGSVWIPNSNGIICSSAGDFEYGNRVYKSGCLPENAPAGIEKAKERRKLGSNKIAVKDLGTVIPYDNQNDEWDNPLNPSKISAYQQSNANPKAVFSSQATTIDVNNATNRPTGAIKAKDDCDKIWTKNTCPGGNEFLVEDIIKTSIDKFRPNIANSKCENIGDGDKNNPTYNVNSVSKINACYENLKNNPILYNGFLVLKFKVLNNSKANSKLKGKFIFIFDEKVGGDPWPAEFILPQMEDPTSMALLYLAKGSGAIEQNNGCDANSNYNYFIYSLGDIPRIAGFTKVCPINGTVYFPTRDPNKDPEDPKSCKTYGQTNINATIQTNSDLLKALQAADVICNPKDPTCNPKAGPNKPVITENDPFPDDHFSTVASRLSVNIDSKEITKEKIQTNNLKELTPSMLVMPRIIRLKAGQINSMDKLKEYYKIIGLNGATVPSPQPTPSCTDMDFTKKGGPYTCEFNTTPKTSKFFVLIE